MTHIPGTIYPLGGKPHLPTMCSHRTGIRRNHRAVTVLCYERGEWEFIRPDGTPAYKDTAEGHMPFRFCSKHHEAVKRSYRDVIWRYVEPEPTPLIGENGSRMVCVGEIK